MNWIEWIALLSGVCGVWLTIKESIWCWPMALVSVVCSMLEFYHQNLLGDFALQIFYFFAGLYGWYFWKSNSNKSFVVNKMERRLIPLFILITLAQCVVYYYLLKQLKSDKVLFDAILTACSLSATYMMTKKWLENWLIWVIIDTAYVFLYGIKAMWSFALLYAFFAMVAFYGWRKWKSSLV